MEDITLTSQLPVTRREWALFGLQWVLPIGLGLYLLGPGAAANAAIVPLIVTGGLAIVCNLVILLALISGHWSQVGTILVIAADVLLVLAGVALADATLVWIGLVPVTLTGFYFEWLPGLLVGLLLAVGIVALQIINAMPADLDLPALLLGLTVLPTAGPLAALLSSDEGAVAVQRDRLRARARRVEQVARLAQEQMQLVYEMADVLNKSKLDPKRVLAAAVSFGLESLERIGVQPPLYGAVLLFAENAQTGETHLRVARASLNLPPSDHMVLAPGRSGVIERVLRTSEPVMSQAPETDPELRMFDSFRHCKSALCLPLRSGDEAYGVMLVGSRQPAAFKDTHIELMYAVTNQAAASLNNVRLYSALLEERDRIVQIEKAARAQLASELHDGPTQGVAAITMRLNYVRKLIERKPDSAVDELYAIEDMARRTTKEIRHMLFELRPKALDQGLGPGLEQLAIKMRETYEQNVQVEVQSGLDAMLDSQTTQTLFAICSEVITNARKHAQASLIAVSIHIMDDMLIAQVADNGVGFDVQKAFSEARQREGHLGLLNLQERAALIEGTLHIESAPGQGTRTTVAVPMDAVRLRREEELNRAQQADSRVVARSAGR